ncbi:unnamed protein product [Lathyrus oleraceus]
MKKFSDKQRRFVEFAVGDKVLVKLQPYCQVSVALRKNQKLGLRYFGPFKVLSRVGTVAYKLALPPMAKIHPVFHVSLLKPCQGPHFTPYMPLPLITTSHGPLIMPQRILQSRMIMVQDRPVRKVLVQWTSFAAEDATWEDWCQLQTTFPSLNLEDKVSFNGGSNVMIEAEGTNGTSQTLKGADTKIRKGQAACDAESKATRKSTREKKPNKLLEDFTI